MNKPMTQADIYKAIEEIDEVVSKKLLAIEQAEKQESAVEHLWECLGRWSSYLAVNGTEANLAPPNWLLDAVIAATSPPRKEWVGLTDDEIVAVNKEEGTCWEVPDSLAITVAKAIEAKLKEKNT
jgi:hypothetical protein